MGKKQHKNLYASGLLTINETREQGKPMKTTQRSRLLPVAGPWATPFLLRAFLCTFRAFHAGQTLVL